MGIQKNSKPIGQQMAKKKLIINALRSGRRDPGSLRVRIASTVLETNVMISTSQPRGNRRTKIVSRESGDQSVASTTTTKSIERRIAPTPTNAM